jgi:hypothetical protein
MATRKIKLFGSGGVTEDDLEVANQSDDPIAELNKRKGWTEPRDEVPSTRALPAKPKAAATVTKKQLEESGLSLRDYLNRERGLTRRGESPAAAKSAPAKAASVTDTGDETARLAARAPAPAKKPTYETSYDRMNRQNREAAAARKSSNAAERDTLAKNIREGRSGKDNSKTLLPEAGMKKGGSVSSRADGIAQRGKTRGKMC